MLKDRIYSFTLPRDQVQANEKHLKVLHGVPGDAASRRLTSLEMYPLCCAITFKIQLPPVHSSNQVKG